MAHLVGQVFWFSMAVAITGIAHMFVVKADLWPGLKRPIDGGRTFRGRPVFGPNKTWRGLAFMMVGAMALGGVQGLFGGGWAARSSVEVIDFAAWGRRWGAPSGLFALIIGYAGFNAVMGFGYALGELPNSFIKRQLEIEPGSTSSGLLGLLFLVIDQADSVIAVMLLGAVFFGFSWQIVLTGTVCLTGLHLFLNGTMYLVSLRRNL